MLFVVFSFLQVLFLLCNIKIFFTKSCGDWTSQVNSGFVMKTSGLKHLQCKAIHYVTSTKLRNNVETFIAAFSECWTEANRKKTASINPQLFGLCSATIHYSLPFNTLFPCRLATPYIYFCNLFNTAESRTCSST